MWPCCASVAIVSVVAAFVLWPASPVKARQSAVASERPRGPAVDFVAVDADGTPVGDLRPSEVEVRISDRVRVVRSLRTVVTASPAVAASTAQARVPPPYGTNDGIAAGRRFVLVVDQESFGAGREQLFRNAVEGLLAQLTPADQTMVAALPFGGVRLPFTSDKARVRLAMDRVSGQGARNETGSDLACRTRRFLQSLEAWLQEQPPRSSPLTLVLFTAGMAAPRRDAPMGLMPGMCELEVDQFRHVATAASAARANFYVMQPADVGIGTAPARPTLGGVGDRGSDNPLEGIEHLAGVTGGARLSLDATGTASLLRVAKESAAYYVAEIEPISNDAGGRSRPLNVRVARRGVTVRVRPEITFAESTQTRTTSLTVKDLLSSPDAFTDLRLRIGGFTVRDSDGRIRLGVVVEPADPAVSLTSAGAILIAGDGQVPSHWFAKDASERPLLGAMVAAPGTYRLRVAAIDSTARPGAAEEDVEAALTPVGPLSLGSLMLGVSRNGATAPQLEFGPEPTAIVYFDIYGGSAGLPLTARAEVARELDGPALVTLPLAFTRADAGRVVASGTVPVGALPPGDYVVRGVVRLESGETGRVMRTLRKVAKPRAGAQ
jgi:VWFA-related protein